MMELSPLLLILILPFVASLAVVLSPGASREPVTWITGLTLLACLIVTLSLYPSVSGGDALRHQIDWIPSLGLNFTLRMDGFAWIFAALVSGIGLLVVMYARYYMSADDPVRRFYLFFLAFTGSMLGVVLSGNLVLLVVFWELTSIFSFLLIGYWQQSQAARDGARMAMTVTGMGGLALLGGVLIVGHIVGSYDLDDVLRSGDLIRSHTLYVPALLLILLGTLTKSAQFPFHFWLPNAMAAPTPVSAFLHSATMVKAGVFLLARLWPALAGTSQWFWILCGVGLCTLLFASVWAMRQTDLKLMLAFTTVMALGLITLLLGIGT